MPHPIIIGREQRYFYDLYNEHTAKQDPNNPDMSYKMGKESSDYSVEGAFTPGNGRGWYRSQTTRKITYQKIGYFS